MKRTFLALSASLLGFPLFVAAQGTQDSPATPAADAMPVIELDASTPAAAAPGGTATAKPAPAGKNTAKPAADGGQAAQEQGPKIGENAGGYWLKDCALNDAFQFLAQKAGKQYFHNANLAGPAFLVTGNLNDGDPEQQMDELAFMFNVELYRKGNTIYALNASQVNQLPQEEFAYQLRYLRPADIETLKAILQPLLTPGTGSVNFEPKTNTILVMDSTKRIEAVQSVLDKIDQPKGQIIVETKILRVTSAAGSKVGVDWTSTLGEGLGLDAQQSLNAMFNLPELNTATRVLTNSSDSSADPSILKTSEETFNRLRVQGSGLVLSPAEVSAVLRLLNSGNLAEQKSNPTLITEDNEQASVSIIDRVPIITATSTLQNGVTQVTEEVRYRIDESDSTDPKDTREIGVTVAVTPTVLPDNTIRMKLRPRTAQITEFIQGVPLQGVGRGNNYPRVAEATIETIARVPNGYSLLIGGFYNESKKDGDTKVPFLGDIPIINFFFKSKEKQNEQTSLVFIITPTAYNPMGAVETLNVTDQLMDRLDLRLGHDTVNEAAPGPAHRPGMKRTLKAMLFDVKGPHQPPEDQLPTFDGNYQQLQGPATTNPPRGALMGPKLTTPLPSPAPQGKAP